MIYKMFSSSRLIPVNRGSGMPKAGSGTTITTTPLQPFNIAHLTVLTPLLITTTVLANMQAVVFKGPLEVALEERPIPQIQDPTDVIVKVRYTALCGR